jgi:predicted RNA binding protein YcfA (HicA-like mRNA interferase family)
MSHGKSVKRRDVERKLKDLGYYFERHGSRHIIWSNGVAEVQLSRSRYMRDSSAREILKKAESGQAEITDEILIGWLLSALFPGKQIDGA